MRVSCAPPDLSSRREANVTASRRILLTLLAWVALAATPLAQEGAAPGDEICAPKGVLIPFAAAHPRLWNTWVANGDLRDRDCGGVAVIELRSRAKQNARGELSVAFKVTTYTKPGQDRKVNVRIDVLVSERVVQSATIEAIDAEEKKNGHGSGYLSLPIDVIQSEANPRLRVSLEVLDD
jgi:hypothetical protein